MHTVSNTTVTISQGQSATVYICHALCPIRTKHVNKIKDGKHYKTWNDNRFDLLQLLINWDQSRSNPIMGIIACGVGSVHNRTTYLTLHIQLHLTQVASLVLLSYICIIDCSSKSSPRVIKTHITLYHPWRHGTIHTSHNLSMTWSVIHG